MSCHPAECEQHMCRWTRARGGRSCLTSRGGEFKVPLHISRVCDGWRRTRQQVWPYNPKPSALGMAVALCSSEPSRNISCLQPACLLPPPLFPADAGLAEPSQWPWVASICSLNSRLAGLSCLSGCGGFVSPWFAPEDGCGTAARWGRHV